MGYFPTFQECCADVQSHEQGVISCLFENICVTPPPSPPTPSPTACNDRLWWYSEQVNVCTNRNEPPADSFTNLIDCCDANFDNGVCQVLNDCSPPTASPTMDPTESPSKNPVSP